MDYVLAAGMYFYSLQRRGGYWNAIECAIQRCRPVVRTCTGKDQESNKSRDERRAVQHFQQVAVHVCHCFLLRCWCWLGPHGDTIMNDTIVRKVDSFSQSVNGCYFFRLFFNQILPQINFLLLLRTIDWHWSHWISQNQAKQHQIAFSPVSTGSSYYKQLLITTAGQWHPLDNMTMVT